MQSTWGKWLGCIIHLHGTLLILQIKSYIESAWTFLEEVI